MDRIKALGRTPLETEEGRQAVQLHAVLMADLAAYETSVVEDWCCLLSDTSDQKLKLPLLRYVSGPSSATSCSAGSQLMMQTAPGWRARAACRAWRSTSIQPWCACCAKCATSCSSPTCPSPSPPPP